MVIFFTTQGHESRRYRTRSPPPYFNFQSPSSLGHGSKVSRLYPSYVSNRTLARRAPQATLEHRAAAAAAAAAAVGPALFLRGSAPRQPAPRFRPASTSAHFHFSAEF
jgi:hypothetical protein